jgi:transposase
MGLHCGIDLHGDNGFYAIVDGEGRRMFQKRLPNDLETVLRTLEPFRDKLLDGVVLESTFNWYWLVDGLTEHHYNVRLGNPAKMEQYNGLKDADDETDAFFLAELSRLKIFPEGYVYPKAERPIRDLLRRRSLLVHQRTAHVLSYKSLVARQKGEKAASNGIYQMVPNDVDRVFDDKRLALMGRTNIATIRFLKEQIREIEAVVMAESKLRPEFEKLLTVPGIGKTLALTIMLETGDIRRFPKVGNYTSYCRCVSAIHRSNEKKKANNNRKNGNRYLSWAYVEAANFMRRFCPEAKRWYDRKRAKSKEVVATKALSAKICKACYFIMKDQVEFDVKKLFG